MRITRIIALSLMMATGTFTTATAQPLRDAGPPAEFPPASYQGKQYIDSRGCVYIRAGIDGNVTWVPRVTRKRQLVCGFQPTLSPAKRAQGPQPTATQPAPVIAITPHGSEEQPVETAPTASAVQPKPKPRRVAIASPKGSTVKPPAPQARENTRVVRRHIYQARQSNNNFKVPNGYRRVWADDRLNPHRAERTLRPSVLTQRVKPPAGYRDVWDDDRLNTQRARATDAGNARTDQLWTRTLPRTLIKQPVRAKTVTIPSQAKRAKSPLWEPQTAKTVTRVSTRSATAIAPRYIRVAVFQSEDQASATAQALARDGLPMRLGRVQRKGQTLRVVLAGPFTDQSRADAALSKLRAAGFPKAKLSK